MSTFDIAVSHLSLTRAERESREEGEGAMVGERRREAMRGTGGSEGRREGGGGFGAGGGGLSGLNSRD